MYNVSVTKERQTTVMKKETKDNVKTDNKIIKLVKLYLAVGCLISAYFLAFTVKSDMQVTLYVIATAPALVGAYLVYDQWVK